MYSIKTLEFTKTESYFYSFTCEKNIFNNYFILPVGRFFCEFVRRQISCGFKTRIFSACLRYKLGFYFFSLNKIQTSKQHRLINLTISYQAGPNLENSSFLSLSSWEKLESPAKSNIQNPSCQSLCKLGKIMNSLTPKSKNAGKIEGIYIK